MTSIIFITKRLLLFPILFLSASLYADNDINFDRLDLNDGLSDNHITCMHQDKDGFMWIATMNGLNRYDGSNFKKIEDEVDIYNNRIMHIDEDNYNNLWLSNFVGSIQYFNKATYETEVYPNSFGYLPLTSNRKLYISEKNVTICAFYGIGLFVCAVTNNGSIEAQLYKFSDLEIPTKSKIIDLYASDNKNFWILMEDGLYYLQIDNNGIPHCTVLFTSMMPINSSSAICVANNKLYTISSPHDLFCQDIETKDIKIIPQAQNIFKNINSICVSNNKIWFLSTHQLFGLSSKNDSIETSLVSFRHSNFSSLNNLKIDQRGFIWFNSRDKEGMFLYKPQIDKLAFIPFPESIYSPQISEHAICEDKNHNLWFGTKSNGILFYNNSSNIFNHYYNEIKNSHSLASDAIVSVYNDKNENIWIGTKYGISLLPYKEKKFSHLQPVSQPKHSYDNLCNSICLDSYGNLWCGTLSRQIYVYDKNKQLKHVFNNKNHAKNGYVEADYYVIYEDNKGRIWFGSKGNGLFFADLKKHHKKLENIKIKQIESPILKKSDIYDIIMDAQDRLWIASYGKGLLLLLDKDNVFRISDYNTFLYPQIPYPINYGRCLMEDKKHNIWYGGLNGICRFSVNIRNNMPNNIKSFYYNKEIGKGLCHNDVKSILELSNNQIVIGTYGGGINIYTPDNETFTHLSLNDGLSNNIIYSTVEDENHKLWIATKNGLSKYSPDSKTFINYSESDGLSYNEFTEAKGYINNNKIYFGDRNGITFFTPTDIKTKAKDYTIMLSDFYVSNKKILISHDGPLYKNINHSQRIILKYSMNNFKLTFATNNLNYDKKTDDFLYKLEGFDKMWKHTINDLSITYTNIPIGKYKLRIKHASNSNPALERQLSLIITPPYWKSKLAYLSYTILILLTIYFFINIVSKIHKLKTSLKLEKEISSFKMKFFTNISHELRTPLSLIINPLRKIYHNKNLDSETKRLLVVVNNNAANIQHLVDEILVFRKLQTNSASLKVSNNEIVTIFNKITNNFYFVAESKNIKFKTSTNVTQRMYWFDPEKIETIINNLLTNAFKFTSQEGLVNVTLFAEFNKFSITIEDSGRGFDTDEEISIFQRFNKKDSQSISFFSKGTGIGLSIVQDYVKLHKGNLEFDSNPDKGTTFIISIPGKETDYSDKEKASNCDWMPQENKYLPSQQHPKANKSNMPTLIPILVIEDNIELLSLLAFSLNNDFKVITAENGAIALKILENYHPDLIITDVMMPEINGIELTKTLKNDLSTSHIPIIMLTARTADDDFLDGYNAGADVYVTKPFDTEVLLSMCNNLIKQRQNLIKRFSSDIDFLPETNMPAEKEQDFLNGIIEIIKENMMNENFSIPILYEKSAMSKTSFYNKIKSLTGMNPVGFVRTIKLREAAKLLKNNTMNVSEVAFKVGFSDVDYFSKQFKKQFGKTASEFIKKNIKY